MRQYWLAKKKNKKVALYPYVEDKEVKFKVVGDGYEPIPKTRYLFTWEDVTNSIPLALMNFIKDEFDIRWIDKENLQLAINEKRIIINYESNSILMELDNQYNPNKLTIKYNNKSIELVAIKKDRIRIYAPFNPSKGSIKKAKATCLVYGCPIDDKAVRRLFQQRKNFERLIAVVLYKESKGKRYRIANENDVKVFKEAEGYLVKKREELMNEWGIDPIPDEPTPEGKGSGAERAFSVRNYALYTWGDLFNARQKLALITFVEKVRQAYKKMIEEGYDEEYAKAVISYLALMLGKLEDWNSVLSVWRADQERNEHVFNRQALPMVWDYGERNPFQGKLISLNAIIPIIQHCASSNSSFGTVTQFSSISNPYNDNFFDAVITDPPYYDNVPYSYLSDFFYVWLKRAIGDLYPELFATPLTPKSEEIVAYTHNNSLEEGKKRFEELLSKAFKEYTDVTFNEYEVLLDDSLCKIEENKSSGITYEIKDRSNQTIPASILNEIPTTNELKEITLSFEVPLGKVSHIMGILNLLQSKFKNLKINIEATNASISEEDYENKIKEGLRQLGIELE